MSRLSGILGAGRFPGGLDEAGWRWLGGIGLMVASTAFYVTSDTCMKLATADLPPLEVLFLRGVSASIWCVPMIVLTGNARKVHLVADARVMMRNALELLAVLFWIVALARAPIADVTAIGQTAPLFLIVGAALFLKERLTALHVGLVVAGLGGALMVAQPGGSDVSWFALLAFGTALGMAARDLVGRGVALHVPSPVVALGAVLVVLVGAGVATFLFEDWRTPSPANLVQLGLSGFVLIFAHWFIFLSYRAAPVRVVAPFLYMFTVWAVISGLVVFADVPDPLTLAGIALILICGVSIVMHDNRLRRIAPVA